jgi:Flp pilus assembly protein TadD
VGKPRRSAAKPKIHQPTPEAPPAARTRTDLYICLALALATLAVYSQVIHFDFLNYDDPDYVTQNIHVRGGLSWDGIVWAFTVFHAANWSPLTWISHMADCQFFGLRSGWHHFSNALLHAAAAILLFAALKRLTGARWPGAFVAFLFALHPLHVESVAWIAERKDVLCALFWFLALLAYAGYAQRPSRMRYAAVLLCFVLGLLAKPMIVTLPAVLLLLDFWPLRRSGWRNLLVEKIPFVVLAAAASVATFLAQQQGYTVRSLATFPLGLRVENAIVSCVVYILRMVWPANLAVFYPYRFRLPLLQVALAAALLIAISVLAVRMARVRPYLAVGWFWYLATLVPVIGLVQVGAQSSADRYTYVPMIGLGIALAWAAADLFRGRLQIAAAAGAAVLAVCAVVTSVQLRYWANSGTLFQHAAEVTDGNFVAYNNLAQYELSRMDNQDGMLNAHRALDIRPAYPEAHTNLALALRRTGKLDDAEREYRTSLQILPVSEPAHAGYGALLAVEGKMNDALREFSEAVQLRPEDDDAHYNLGRTLAALGRVDDAASEYYETLRLNPDNVEAHHSLGFLLLSRGRMNDAVEQLRDEARLKPADAAVHYNLANLLVSLGRRDEARAEFNQALRIRPDYPDARRRLELLK